MITKPNFLVVGAAKAGSTTLYNILKSHPNIYLSPIKEVHYFSKDIDISKFSKEYKDTIELNPGKRIKKWDFKGVFSTHIQSSELYYELFSKVQEHHKLIGEVSPSYLYSSVAAKNIKEELDDSKIIMILRNPITRAFSHYLMDVRIGYTKESFSVMLDKEINLSENYWGLDTQYLGLGLYYHQVKRYVKLFGDKNVLVLFTEDLKNEFESTVEKLFNFLGLETLRELNEKNYNTAALPSSVSLNYILRKTGIKKLIGKVFPEGVKEKFRKYYYKSDNIKKISDEDRKFLQDYFKDDIQKLSKLLNKNLEHWK